MSDNLLATLDRAYAFTEQVVGAVPDNTRHSTTPCPEYDVTALVGHLSAGIHWYSRIPEHGISDPSAIADEDLTDCDLLAVIRSQTALARRSWTAQDLDRTFPAPFGDMTGEGMTGFMVMELLGHGLDLALATGQSVRPEEDLTAVAMAVAAGMGDMLRSPKMMGPAVAVADDAPAADRFLGLIGRDPAWTPSAL